ncbi:capsule biosynthesis protein [Chitinibacter sp. SCUT-21]|uniref:capsule biosynthesis protein n=1 Tax=Chitinibacter sp. SCUT-21 TaxID=2970891 RepID=UPI0035A6A3A0
MTFFKDKLFIGTVAIPTFIATIYFGIIASDVFTSESSFVVRSQQKQSPSSLNAILQSNGIGRAGDETYPVHDFISSRDALRELEKTFNLKEKYGSQSIDFIGRFPGILWDNNFEDFHLFFLKKANVEFDLVTGITTLKVSAYEPKLAQEINIKLLKMSEDLINRLNLRAREDSLAFASKIVNEAEEETKKAAISLSKYRNQSGVFDPYQQSAGQLKQITALTEELIKNQVQLAQLQDLTPNNPQIPSVKNRISSLQNIIALEKEKITGKGTSLSSEAAEFQKLSLDQAFAERRLAAAMTFLEQARADSLRQSLYIERIAEPHLPDVATQPKRFRGVLATFIIGLILWGVLSMLLAGVREHKD